LYRHTEMTSHVVVLKMADRYKGPADNRPFFDEIDDYTFLSHPQQGSSGYVFDDEKTRRLEAEKQARKQQQIMEEMQRIQERTVESSARSLGLVYESEEVGVQTAENLLHQREQLERSEANVSNINRALRSSQKHINSIKSIFSGFSSMFSKTPETAPQPVIPEESVSKPTSALAQTVDQSKSQPAHKSGEHPALKIRGIDYGEESGVGQSDLARGDSIKRQGLMDTYEMQLDDNLGNLSLGLGRLKGLAIGLGSEIEEQNEILDRLGASVDKADLGIGIQNKQMQKILKK